MTSIKLFALLILLSSSVAHAGLYRWIDENGKVHFSDKVPPKMAQKGHTSLNKNGIKSATISSAKVLKKQQAEADLNNDVLAEMSDASRAEAVAAAQQKRKDEQLLAQFESKEDVISVFQKKLFLIDQSIGIISARDESQTQKLIRLKQKYKKSKQESSRMTLSMQIANAQENLKEYQKAIQIKRADKEVVTDNYRQTLIRFNHLTQASQKQSWLSK